MPSSVVAKYDYNPQTSVLRVIYVSGAVYDYLNVPEEVYEAMKKYTSKGTYLNKFIKPNYEFNKVK